MPLKLHAALVGVAASALLLLGCNAAGSATLSPTATVPLVRSVALDTAFPLRGGETVDLAAQGMVLTFAFMTSDSRCPTDVACPRAGGAVLHFTWSRSGGQRGAFDLRIGAGGSGMARFSRYVVTAGDLLPQPTTSNLRPSLRDYQVTLRVELA
ncbi:MAG: hypothetical protein HY675_12715 [Chloroflexi bacterium]|nr:hypothetical protein [Chloroflexota bacterium]